MRQPASWYAVERVAIRTGRLKRRGDCCLWGCCPSRVPMFDAAVQVLRSKPAWQHLFNIAFSSVYLGDPYLHSHRWAILNRSETVSFSISSVSLVHPELQEYCMEPQQCSRCCWAAHLLWCRMQLLAHPLGKHEALSKIM